MENINQSTSQEDENLKQQISEEANVPQVNLNASKFDKNKIATWCGFIGGAIFFILNIATKGKVPGGFKGGVVGFIAGYGFVWLVLTIFKKSEFIADVADSCFSRVICFI
ncbi:MAG: hypothetical protein IPJ45_09565 [Ignavibacteria bacterium]|nr:hypothetical protein [Ignavibacteria bacterium]